MKKSDIKVGVEYVASSSADYERWGATERVRVIGEAFTTTEPSYSGGYRATKKVSWVPVHVFRDGKWQEHEGQKRETRRIREEWAPFIERRNEVTRRRRAARLAQEQAQDERARKLLDLIPALRHAGVLDSRGYTYNDEVRALIEKHCPEIFVLNEDGGTTSYFTGPLAESYDDFIRTGAALKISADVLLKAIR